MKSNFDPMLSRLETFNIISSDVRSQLEEMIKSDDMETYVMARDFIVTHYYDTMSDERKDHSYNIITDVEKFKRALQKGVPVIP